MVMNQTFAPSPAKRTKAGKVTKKRMPKSSLQLVDEVVDEGVPEKEPAHDDEEEKPQRALSYFSARVVDIVFIEHLITESKEFKFIAALKGDEARRIYQNLECFIGGRVREIDYRLLQRTE
ncbi:hypothetical protein Tco_0157364 [Tanacetum coccineum]